MNTTKPINKVRVRFPLNATNEFDRLYGCFAGIGIEWSKMLVVTHDMEEQWLNANLKRSRCIKFLKCSGIAVFHFNVWTGRERYWRYFASSRGVGFWQHLLRSGASLKDRIASLREFWDANRQLPIYKPVLLVILGLPKAFAYKAPMQICYVRLV